MPDTYGTFTGSLTPSTCNPHRPADAAPTAPRDPLYRGAHSRCVRCRPSRMLGTRRVATIDRITVIDTKDPLVASLRDPRMPFGSSLFQVLSPAPNLHFLGSELGRPLPTPLLLQLIPSERIC